MGFASSAVRFNGRARRVQSVPHRQRSKPQASNTRASGSQMSGKGYGAFDSVQAPLTLITTFGRLARSSTFGRSAQGCGGAGGTRGCRMPRWARVKRVLGDGPGEEVDGKGVAKGGAQDAVMPRIVGAALLLVSQEDADADRARRLLPLRDDVVHRGIVRVDRLDDGEAVGMRPLHLDR